MAIDLRLPNINASTDTERLSQMQSYIYQLVGQLNWALNALETAGSGDGDGSVVVQNGSQTASVTPSAEDTFNSIKALIIKSADIVNAYYDTISMKLSGVYVAQSAYGAYAEKTTADITANANGITQVYDKVQLLDTDLVKLESTVRNTVAYIKSGELGTDSEGYPIYGIEVGQNNDDVWSRYARFTASGIYFYIPGASDAVAWMTGQKLYITNAQITGSLTLGGYSLDLSNGIAFKWSGGES